MVPILSRNAVPFEYMQTFLRRYEALRPFTEAEAWMLYRLVAWAEAVGWSLLIIGLLIKRYLMHGNDAAVLIAGNIHGTIFLCYFAAVIVLYPSIGWSRLQGLLALIAGVPPYGSLLYELWAANHRKNHGFQTYRQYMIYIRLITMRAK